MSRTNSVMNNVVLIHIDATGAPLYYVAGDGARLIVVDERCKNDRVYECLERDDPNEIARIIGASPIGSNQDERHAALERKIERALSGKPHLEVVKT